MTDKTIEQKIEQALIKYLHAEHDIDAVSAQFDETEYHKAYWTGCDTCGYGGDSDYMDFQISYREPNGTYSRYVTIDGDPLGFFPTLIKYFD